MTSSPFHREPVILFVDDEDNALKYFSKAIGKFHTVYTASSVAEARERIAEIGEQLGVVVSDQRMPRETGVQLLNEVRSTHPSVVRILTTAYADLDSAVDAVNSGFAYQYIQKPWDVKDLRGIMRRALDYHRVQYERDLLLREKLSTLQRMIVVDRVRSFAVLAAGLANRLRNPLTALKTFLEMAPTEPVGTARDQSTPQVQWDDLWDLARDESERVLQLIQQVIHLTAEPEYRFDEPCSMDALLQDINWERTPQLTVEDGLGRLRCDRGMLRRVLNVLCERLSRLRPDAVLSLDISSIPDVWGAPGVRFSLRMAGEALDQREVATLFAALSPGDHHSTHHEGDSDLLAAYFCAFHHSGNLKLSLTEAGAGIDLDLPYDPDAGEQPPLEANWIERIFTLFEP